jgi:uncharacterized protein YgbK (DUF1537 family)
MTETKIVVLDDDPTGSQTVHSCLLLTRWDVTTLKEGLLDASPLFFVLTNTRGMNASRAAAVTREVCVNLKQALQELATRGRTINPIMVSRSDSTLRGHYPVETDVIAEELGPFDAHFIVPAFFEGGRITRDSTHYLMVDGKPVPVHETEFARDSVFAYKHSHLPDYIEEKTNGKIKANQVQRFLLADVRGDSAARLMALANNTCCVVDAERQSDLNYFCLQLTRAARNGKRYLFRSAASLLTAFAQLSAQPVKAEEMGTYTRNGKAGALIVGSHVKKTTTQLNSLLSRKGLRGIEVDVTHLQKNYVALLKTISEQIRELHHDGITAVVYTSRAELQFSSQAERLVFGERVSRFLMDVVQQLPVTLGFLISKGGITSNDVLSTGLALRASRVLGQILPGCSVVRCPDDHPRYAKLPVVIFPGNVGDDDALANVYERMSLHAQAAQMQQQQ